MTPSNKLLSDLVSFRTYSKYLQNLDRREVFEETVNRTMMMHLDRFPKLSKEITKAFNLVHQFKVMPSMRTLQFGGSAIIKNNARGYNCSFTHISTVRKFSEILFLLLSGTGVGYSVQRRHVSQLPPVKPPRQEGVFIIQDSIHGWAQALHMLVDAYFNASVRPVFDFSAISPKGTMLPTTGSKAPGPAPLKYMLEEVDTRLKRGIGRKLRPIEIHDIICLISDCVLSGGIRRSSLISLFDKDDDEMMKCKSGDWREKHPYRARANNSVVLVRGEVTKEEFLQIFNVCAMSGFGEPGFFWTNDPDMGTNPCVEIGMRPNQFCNLTIVNQTGISSEKDFYSRIYSAAFIGTLQAAYTDFPYLGEEWKIQTEAEALLGVSFTGIADAQGIVTDDMLIKGAELVLDVNKKYAPKIDINLAARTTCVKPEGTSSCVLGSSSGIHARKARRYLRRVQINKDDALYLYLLATIPDLVEDAIGVPNTAVITIPQEAPEGTPTEETETSLELFDRVIRYNKNWVSTGHRSGANKHNVSCTLSVRQEEWTKLAQLMWKERDNYSGISLFPFELDDTSFEQLPFESCTKEKFEQYSKLVKEIDLTEVKEYENNTKLMESVACSGASGCEVRFL
jgi:ribonucleoside-triphosphate reductase